MCTLAYLIWDPQISTLSICLAGHPPPVVIGQDGALQLVGTPTPPLGLMEGHEPLTEVVKLEPGDTMIVYTDGYAMGHDAPPETIMPLLEGAHSEDLDSLLDRLLQALAAAQPVPRDDIVLLAVKAR